MNKYERCYIHRFIKYSWMPNWLASFFIECEFNNDFGGQQSVQRLIFILFVLFIRQNKILEAD